MYTLLTLCRRQTLGVALVRLQQQQPLHQPQLHQPPPRLPRQQQPRPQQPQQLQQQPPPQQDAEATGWRLGTSVSTLRLARQTI